MQRSCSPISTTSSHDYNKDFLTLAQRIRPLLCVERAPKLVLRAHRRRCPLADLLSQGWQQSAKYLPPDLCSHRDDMSGRKRK